VFVALVILRATNLHLYYIVVPGPFRIYNYFSHNLVKGANFGKGF